MEETVICPWCDYDCGPDAHGDGDNVECPDCGKAFLVEEVEVVTYFDTHKRVRCPRCSMFVSPKDPRREGGADEEPVPAEHDRWGDGYPRGPCKPPEEPWLPFPEEKKEG